MIRGADDGRLFLVRDYREDGLKKVLEEFLSSLRPDDVIVQSK